MPPRPSEHRVSIVISGRELAGWTEYQLDTSLTEPADSFSLTRPFDLDAWLLCVTDAHVRVLIDGRPRIDGFIDTRTKSSGAGTLTIEGRDRVGHLVQESAPRAAFNGQTMLAVLEVLAAPWFQKVTLSNARNRKVTLGKGSKVAGDDEAIALLKGKRSTGKATDPITAMFKKSRGGSRIDPGQSRWAVIEQVLSRAGLSAWSSADGRELIVGKPNHDQAATFLFRNGRQSNVIEMEISESVQDRFSMITAVGSGAGSGADFGEAACSRAASVFDNPDNITDGTGRDFLFAKRLVLGEQGVRDREEAGRIATREQQRRDFDRHKVSVTVEHHGQVVKGTHRTLFATDTIARVLDDDTDLVDEFLIYSCSFTGSREQGERTDLEMVPRGTEIVL